jgi:uncharacterized protein (TIGR02099 family)
MKKTLKLIDVISHVILIAFVFIVVVVAVASSLLRHYSPDINQYREVFLGQINERSKNMVVDAKEIRSEWNLFQPQISLYGVTLKSAGQDQDLNLEKIDIKLNFIKSLLSQKLYFDHIEFSNMQLLFIEDKNGEWHFAHQETGSNEKSGIETIINRIWSIDELLMQNVRVSLLPYQGKQIDLPDLTARITTYKSEKQFNLQLMEDNKQLGHLIVNTKHNPYDDNFRLKGYVSIKNYSIADVASLFTEASIVKEGKISNEFWFYWRNQRSVFNGQITLDNMVLAKNSSLWKLDSIKTTITGNYDDQQWFVESPKTIIQGAEENFTAGPLSLKYKDSFVIQAKQLNLADAHQFSSRFPLPEALKDVLATLSPKGSLQNLHIQWGLNTPFLLQSQLNDISVAAWNGAPALNAVNGYLKATEKTGFVEFDTKNFSMFFPQLYKKPMLFDSAKGYVDWRLGQDTIYVSGNNLLLEAKSGNAHGEFGLSLPQKKSAHESVRLSLNIGMKNTAAEFKNIFIPLVVSEGLVDWLDKNILQGNLPEVAFIYHGPAQKESQEPRVIQLWLNVENAVLTYADQWPAIEAIDGQFLLDDEYGFAHIKKAKTEKLLIKTADFSLSPLADGNLIEIDAKTEGTSNQVLAYLKNNALAEKMDHVIDEWQSDKGHITAQVKVSAELSVNNVQTSVDVASTLQDVSVMLPQHNVKVQNISGPVRFNTETGLSSDGLMASFLGKPMTAKIISTGKTETVNTAIQIQGSVNTDDFAKWSQQPVDTILDGSALFNTEIYYGSAGSGLRVSSALNGIQVNLPKPFGKKHKTKKEFSLHLPFTGEQREMDITYGEGINAHFLLANDDIESGVINLGLNKGIYEQGKIILGGQVLEINTQEWLDVIARYKELTKDAQPSVNKQPLVFVVENLKIKTLKAYDQVLDSVSLDLFSTVSYWQLGIDHKDLKATLKIYQNEQPMDLHLHRVNLEFLSKKQAESGVGYANKSLSEFPDINVTIDKLISAGEDFGEWEFKMRSYQDHMALENIQASFKAMRLTSDVDDGATLYWTLGEHPKTYFKGKFVSENIAHVLKAWGYKQEVNSEKAEFKVSSSWNGVPSDFKFNNIIAQTQLKLEKGNFSDVSSSSTDALKLVGVFNIANLVKRLQLDFSDLTSQGLSYDTVSGVVSSDHGVYKFDQPILVKSSASKIRLYGGFNMNTRQLDMTMGVTLPLASNLPWIVGLAAGLPTAAGIYIISKVLDKQVDKISSAVYAVTGDFDDPQIKFNRLFDTEEDFEKQNLKQKITTDTVLEVKPD